MSNFEVLKEAIKNLMSELDKKELSNEKKNKIVARLFNVLKEVKEIQFIFDLL